MNRKYYVTIEMHSYSEYTICFFLEEKIHIMFDVTSSFIHYYKEEKNIYDIDEELSLYLPTLFYNEENEYIKLVDSKCEEFINNFKSLVPSYPDKVKHFIRIVNLDYIERLL